MFLLLASGFFSPTALLAQANSTTTFVNATGTSIDTYILGTDAIFIQVTDPDQAGSTLNLNIVRVNRAGADEVANITLNQVTSGTYRGPTGGLASVFASPANLGNAILEANNFDGITAVYTDPGDPTTDTSSDIATVTRVQTIGQVTFTESTFTNPKEVFILGADSVFIRVTDNDRDNDASVADTFTVQVGDSGGDAETVTLTETGVNTGVFTASLALAAGSPSIGNGSLQSSSGNTLTVTYTDSRYPAAESVQDQALVQVPTDATVRFTTTTGTVKTAFSIAQESIFVTVTDKDEDTNPATQQSFVITVSNQTGSDSEVITLAETANNSGIFRNLTGLVSSRATVSVGDNTLQAQPGDTVFVQYTDPTDGNDTDSHTALMQLQPSQATLSFTDSGGNSKFNFTIGVDPVFVTVADADRDAQIGSVETITVALTDPNTSDSETLTLTETGANTGIFRGPAGGLASARVFTGFSGNNFLETVEGSNIRADYSDPINGDVASGTAQMRHFTNSSTRFTDTFGTDQSTYVIGLNTVFVTVSDADRNLDPVLAETVTATIVVATTGDSELVNLTETGVNTGVFRNQTGLVLQVSGAAVNGILDVTIGGQLTVTYTDSHDGTDQTQDTAVVNQTPVGSATTFIDSFGADKTEYVIAIDGIFVQVLDADQNTNATVAETVDVVITSTLTSDQETVTLTETGVNTGVFRSLTGLPSITGTASIGDGVLQTSHLDTVQARYTDPNDGGDITTDFATMRIAPAASTLTFTDTSGNPVSQYAIGPGNIFLTLTDADENISPTTVQSVVVTLTNATTSDSEPIFLTETGVDTGVFRNASGISSILSLTGLPSNGQIESGDGNAITARYEDKDGGNPPDIATAGAVLRFLTDSSLRFTDSNGIDVTQYTIGSDLIFVTLTDLDEGSATSPPPTTRTVQVSVSDPVTGDVKILTLTELTTQLGTFRNLTGLVSVLGAADPVDTRFRTSGNALATGRYTDSNDPTDSDLDTVTMKNPQSGGALNFVNSVGTPVSTITIGTGFFVRLEDADRNLNPLALDQLFVTVIDGSTGDIANLLLTEIGPNVGTFQNGTAFPLAIGLPNADGILQTADGSLVTANYSDDFNPGETAIAFATAVLTPNPANARSAVFTDGLGNAVTRYSIGVDPIFVTVTEPDANSNAVVSDTITVSVRNFALVPPDRVALVLQEINPVNGQAATNTGVFRNLVGVQSVLAPVANSSNSLVEARDADFITIDYLPKGGLPPSPTIIPVEMKTPSAGSITQFTNAAGTPVAQYSIGADPLFVTVTDPDENGSPGALDFVTVNITSSITGATINVTLTEVGLNNGVFRNTTGVLTSLDSVPGSPDGRYHTANGAIVTATYRDNDDANDSSVSAATMAALQVPAISIELLESVSGPVATRYEIFTAGKNRVFLRVRDDDENGNPLAVDSVRATLISSGFPINDTENVTLSETGVDTGIFVTLTGIPLDVEVPTPANSILEAFDGGRVTGRYVDKDSPGDILTTSVLVSVGKVPVSTVFFSDGISAAKTTFTVGTDPVFVTLVDENRNKNAAITETAPVTVTSLASGDRVNVLLLETSPSSGQFRNLVGITTEIQVPNASDTLLQVIADTDIQVDYQDPEDAADTAFSRARMKSNPTLSIVRFSNSLGATVGSYRIATDLVFVTVTDADQNLNPAVPDTLPVQIVSSITSDTETVTLTEISPNSGIFRNTIGVATLVGPPTQQNRVIETAGGAILTVTYRDPDDNSDVQTAFASMVAGQTPSATFFIPSLGSPVTTSTFFIAQDLIFARVVDTDQNLDPTRVESLQAFIERIRLPDETTSPPALPSAETQDDQEVLTFVEVDATGAQSTNSSIFESVVPISSAVDRIQPGNGIIEAAGDSTVRVRYVDPEDNTDISQAEAIFKTPFVNAVLRFTDGTGTDVTEYTIGSPDGVFLTLDDSQRNKIASVRDTAVVSIFDSTTGNVVGVILDELLDAGGIPNTGLFRNTRNVSSQVAFPPAPVTEDLFTADNSLITGSYLPENAAGASFSNPAFDPTIQQILTKTGPNATSCYACHSDGLTEGGFNITGYRDFIRGGSQSPIVTGNAVMSLLVQKLEDPAVSAFAQAHGFPIGVGDPALKVDQVISRSDLETLKQWINQAAQPPTLPTSINYDLIQATIFTPSCVADPTGTIGCHDFGSQAGGIRLDDFSGFQDAVANRSAAVLGNGPKSLLVQVLVDPNLPHSGRKVGGPININVGAVQQISQYISQQYPQAGTVPLREYTGDVQSLFDRSCVNCHNPGDRQGGLSLSSFQGLNMGGNSGVVFNRGDVPKSRILDKLDATVDPTHVALVPSDFFTGPVASRPVSILTSWINQGAFPGAAGPLAGAPVGAVTDTAIMKVGPTSASVMFTDVLGIEMSFFEIGNDGVYVTITDPDQNRDPLNMETVTVRVTDSRTDDDETLTLTETTAGSGIFRNIQGVPSEVAFRLPGDGRIQSLDGSILTATYGDSPPPDKVDTVVMSANSQSSLAFVDAAGLSKGTFQIGSELIFIQVTDADQAGKGRLDAGTVSVTVDSTSDSERNSLVLDELATQPGVFRSQGLSSAVLPAALENGAIETTVGGQMFAIYTDPAFSMDTSQATALTVATPTTAQVSFTDQNLVTTTQFRVQVDDIFIRVDDKNRDRDPTTTETIQVSLRNEALVDVETVTLTERGVDTGVFVNVTGIPTQLTVAASTIGNGVLEIRDLRTAATFAETIRVDYSDSVSPPDDQTAFANVIVGSQSVVEFVSGTFQSVTGYTRGTDLIFVRVTDSDQNRDRSVRESLIATVFDDIAGDMEQVDLIETAVNSGIFRTEIGLPSTFAFPLPTTDNNGILEARVNSFLTPSQSIRVEYVDPIRNLDLSQDTATLTPKDPNDTDDDQVPDSFENANGMNPFDPTDAALDFDNDGWTNLEEFLDGTDPLNPFDRKPTAVAGNDFSIDPGVIQLDGSQSFDPRNLPLRFRWNQVNLGIPGRGNAVTLSDPAEIMPTFIGLGGRDAIGQDFSIYEFDLVVSNFRVSSNPNRVAVTVNNLEPDTDPGPKQAILVGTSLILNGGRSKDANNEELSFDWTAATGVSFQGASAQTVEPIATALVVGAHPIDLTVSDPALNQDLESTFLIAHSQTDHVPLADAGPDLTGSINQAISIDGSGSADADTGDTLAYIWTVTKAPSGVGALSTIPPVSVVPKTNLVAPQPGYYEITLRVQDLKGNLSPPSVMGVVANFPGSSTQIPQTVPRAEAGVDRTVSARQNVVLDGTQSQDAENQPLTFTWRQVKGRKVRLSQTDIATPSFIPVFPGNYLFELVVSDGVIESAPDRVRIIVNNPVAGPQGPVERVPVAGVGEDQVVTLGASPVTVLLDGSASSDADGDSLSFYWEQISGPGVPLVNSRTAFPNFQAPKLGSYVFELTVFDGKNPSPPVRTRVQVTPVGKDPPVADAGDNQTIFLVSGPVRVQLDGRGSFDPQGQPLTFLWTQTDGVPVQLMPSSSSSTPFFFASRLGNYRFRLSVKDPFGLTSQPSTVVITVIDGQNAPPQVKLNGSGSGTATLDARSNTEITLDASQSSSRSGSGLSFIWRQISGPANLLLPHANQSQLRVLLKAQGTYTFQVTVIDGLNNRADGTVTVFVAPQIAGAGAETPLGGITPTTDINEVIPGIGGGGGGGGGCEAIPSVGGTGSVTWLPLFLFWLGLVMRGRRRE